MVGLARINELFDIIVEYPSSINSLDDLKNCLRYTNLEINMA